MTSTAGRQSATVRFGELDVAYDSRILQPRPWTAAQSRWATELLAFAPAGPVLELCAGAGQIGLLAISGSDRSLVAVDADPVACDFAQRNARSAGLEGRVEVRNALLEEALAEGELFPVIIADPPWVPSRRTPDNPDDPVFAIDGGADGLTVALACVEVARAHLAPYGVMLLQLGTRAQADELVIRTAVVAPELLVEEIRQPDPTGLVVCLRRSTG
jgi:release factor glutamine methyltransferase